MCKCSVKCKCKISSITKGDKGDTGATGPEGPQGPEGPNGWSLNGNTEGSEKYFGTNDNFDIPIYTNNVSRGLFDKSGNFGFGIISSLTARVHIKGSGATSGTFSLKIINSSDTPLLSSRNDGNVVFGDSSDISSQFMDFKGSTFFKLNKNTTSNLEYDNSGQLFLRGLNGNGSMDFQFTSIAAKSQNVIRGSSSMRLAFAAGADANMQLSSAGNLFIGLDGVTGVDASARLHVKGSGTSSSTFGFRVDDGADLRLFNVRNDGYIIQKALNAAITNGSLNASEYSTYIDETGNNFIIKVKYADGATVKTATIALV